MPEGVYLFVCGFYLGFLFRKVGERKAK